MSVIDGGCFWLYSENTGDDGTCRSKMDSSLGCGDAQKVEQCGMSDVSVSVLSTDCFWLYKESDTGSSSGTCWLKSDNTLTCSDVIRGSSQCNDDVLSGTFLENKCFLFLDGSTSRCLTKCELIVTNTTCIDRDDCRWIYSNTDNDNFNSGKCYNMSVVECKDIFQSSQCESGLNINISGLNCGMYGTTCKPKCGTLTSETCTSDNRENDCYYIMNNNEVSGTCTNRVCMFFYFYLYLI